MRYVLIMAIGSLLKGNRYIYKASNSCKIVFVSLLESGLPEKDRSCYPWENIYIYIFFFRIHSTLKKMNFLPREHFTFVSFRIYPFSEGPEYVKKQT